MYAYDEKSKFREELNNRLTDRNLSIEELREIIEGLSNTWLPEMKGLMACRQHSKYHKYDLLNHTMDVVMTARLGHESDLILGLSALLHDIGKPEVETVGVDGYNHYYGHSIRSAEITERFLKNLDYTKDIVRNTTELVLKHDYIPYKSGKSKKKVRRFVADMTNRQLERWIILKRADLLSHTYAEQCMIEYADVVAVMQEVKNDGTAITIKELALKQGELKRLLMGLNITKDEEVKILEALRSDCLANPCLNNHDWLAGNARYKLKQIRK